MADARQIAQKLESAASDPDFNARSSELVDAWVASGSGLDAVEPVLRFMESHPGIEYGMPGALVHFAERFHGRGYEPLLLASVSRRPTWITTWMLNRLINGTRELASRRSYVDAMVQASRHPQADQRTLEQVRRFLSKL